MSAPTVEELRAECDYLDRIAAAAWRAWSRSPEPDTVRVRNRADDAAGVARAELREAEGKVTP